MRTKAAALVVKLHSKRMEQLSREMDEFAKELESMDLILVKEDRHLGPSYFTRFMSQVRDNRKEREELQEDINLLCLLETFLPEPKRKSKKESK